MCWILMNVIVLRRKTDTILVVISTHFFTYFKDAICRKSPKATGRNHLHKPGEIPEST